MSKGIALAGTLCVDYLKQVNGYPLPGMLSTILSVSRTAGGAVPNMGTVLKRMDPDLSVRAAGLVGDDENGEYALSVMSSAGMDISGIQRVRGEATAFTDAMLDIRTGERTFFTMKGACAKFGLGDINFDTFTGCSIFHIAYALLLDAMDAPDEEFGTMMARTLHEATKRGFITSMDVVSEQGDRFARVVTPSLRYCDYLIVNEIEASGICGIPARDAEGRILQANMEPICRALLDAGVRRLAAVHAPEGGWCMEKGGRFSFRPSLKLAPEDIKSTVGAGDAFCAGMLYALNRGDNVEDALDLGAGAAACVLGGAGMKPAGEIGRMLREMPRRAN